MATDQRPSSRKRYVPIPPDPEAASWNGPVVSRGWLCARDPWRHPIAVVSLFLQWLRLKRQLDKAPGLLLFEYRFRFDCLLFGMHICWRSKEDERVFYKTSSHQTIADWAMRARLLPAVKLEHLALDSTSRIIRLGGFYACEQEGDLPPGDFLFPSIGANPVCS